MFLITSGIKYQVMITGYFDGSCGPENPGGDIRYGWCVTEDEVVIHSSSSGIIPIQEDNHRTNNLAEYLGIQSLLEFISNTGIEVDEIYGDSKMVINMITGVWGKKKPHKKFPHLLKPLKKCRELYIELSIPITWIPREENEIADYLSKCE